MIKRNQNMVSIILLVSAIIEQGCQQYSGDHVPNIPDSHHAVNSQDVKSVPFLPADPLPISIGSVQCLALSPDNRYLVWGESSFARNPGREIHEVRVWSIPRGQQITRLSVKKEVTDLAFSPDGRLLAFSSFLGAVQLRNVETWKQQAILGDPGTREDDVYGLIFSPDSKSLAVGDQDHRVRVWDIATRKDRLFGKLPYFPTHFSFSPDGRFLAVADFCEDIKVWETATGQEYWSFVAHTDPVTKREGVQGIAFRPDGKSLVTAGTDGMVRVWDVPGKKEIKHFHVRVGEVNAMALSPDGKMVAVAGGTVWHPKKPGGVRIWDLNTGLQLAERGPLDCGVSCLCFSHDGVGLAVGTYGNPEGRVFLWKLAEIIENTPMTEGLRRDDPHRAR
jgi:WD40 repeat protein